MTSAFSSAKGRILAAVTEHCSSSELNETAAVDAIRSAARQEKLAADADAAASLTEVERSALELVLRMHLETLLQKSKMFRTERLE